MYRIADLPLHRDAFEIQRCARGMAGREAQLRLVKLSCETLPEEKRVAVVDGRREGASIVGPSAWRIAD